MTATAQENKTATEGTGGRIARVIGPVVDIEFPVDSMPDMYNLLETEFTLGGETRTLEVPAPSFEEALDVNHSLLRSALAVTGAGVLRARGNLPVDPTVPRELDDGSYYVEPKSMVERLLQLRAGGFGYMNLEALIDLAGR